MKFIVFPFLICLFLVKKEVAAQPEQSYFEGRYKIIKHSFANYNFTLYDFSRDGNVLKAKYFAQDAYNQYLNWRNSKQILLITAGAFSESWETSAKPIGLCVDNGVIINRSINYNMGGMVIIYNGGAQQGGIAVVDMDIDPVKVQTTYNSGKTLSYYPKTSSIDRLNFLKWGESQGVTLFQTQLVFSSVRPSNFNKLEYGEKRERRFLVICKKNNLVHHVVVDAPGMIQLNLSGSYVKKILESDGFNVISILNLDTGDKNILFAYSGGTLKNQFPYLGKRPDRAILSKATNLLIYYKD